MFVPGSRIYDSLIGSATNQNYVMVPTIAPSIQYGLAGSNLGLNWYGIGSVVYQPYWSTNLADWLPFGSPLPGTNGLMEALIPIGPESLKFFRVGAQN